MRYVLRKPAIVIAIQFDGTLESIMEIKAVFPDSDPSYYKYEDGKLHNVKVTDTAGRVTLNVGNYLAKFDHISIMMKKEQFEEAYEPIL